MNIKQDTGTTPAEQKPEISPAPETPDVPPNLPSGPPDVGTQPTPPKPELDDGT